MSETPGAPEYYTPPTDAAPPLVPEPPSISYAAGQWDAAQGQAVYGQPAYGQAAQWNTAQGGATPGSGLAITSLVLGIVGVVTGWLPVWGLLIGLAAIVFGSIALAKKQSKGMAISGLVLGAVSALMSIVVGFFFWIGANQFNEIGDEPDFGFGDPQATLGPESADGGLTITEQAFAPSSWDEGTTWFVVVLNNPGANAYDFAEVTVNALDASGAIVDTALSFPSLPPGESVVVGSFYELDGAQVASLEVVGPTADSAQTDPGVQLEVSDVTATSDDFFTTATGTVTSPTADLEFSASVTVIARDESGTISGYASSYVDPLAQGESGQFEAVFFQVMPAGTTYEAYAEAF